MRHQKGIKLVWIILCFILSSVRLGIGQTPQGELLVDKNAKLSLELLSALSTATNKKDDKFSCKVLSPAELAGAVVEGHVRKAKRSGKEKGKSEMDLAFDTITLPDGRAGKINAQITEVFDVVDAGDQGRADKEGTVKAKSTVKRDALKIGAGTAIGAAIGGLLGGGTGALIGGAIGASIASATVLATSGPDLEFKQGTQFTVIVNSPTRQSQVETVAASTNKEATSIHSEAPDRPALTPIQPSPNTSTPVVQPTTENQAVPQPSRPAKPNPPAARYQTYTGNNSFRLSVPANWRESSNNNPVTFAPDRGNLLFEGQPNLTHGVMAGVAPTSSGDPQEALSQITKSLLQGNTYLHQQGTYQKSTVSGRNFLSSTLSGVSEVTGSEESVTVHTTLLRNNQIFYLITVVPQDELSNYQSAFQNILRSIQINE
jgi:outer membrane lipoprotein SlyB